MRVLRRAQSSMQKGLGTSPQRGSEQQPACGIWGYLSKHVPCVNYCELEPIFERSLLSTEVKFHLRPNQSTEISLHWGYTRPLSLAYIRF